MFTPVNIILALTGTATALIAGLFYSWSCSVVLGFARLPDAAYIEAFQQTNRAILNPVFFATFIGTLLLLPLSTYLHYTPHPSMRFWLLLAASVIYAVGTFGVTMAGNVPMNDLLDKFDLKNASAEAIALARKNFESRWNSLNIVRAITSTLSVLLVIIACLAPHNKEI